MYKIVDINSWFSMSNTLYFTLTKFVLYLIYCPLTYRYKHTFLHILQTAIVTEFIYILTAQEIENVFLTDAA